MKNLTEYLSNNIFENMFESHMTKSSWEHRGDYKYAMMVIDLLTKGEAVKLGDKEATGSYQATPEEIEQLKGFDPTEHTDKDFDAIFNGRLKWNQIFKGTFSGFANGLASGNKGNAFEDEFVKNFHEKYQSDLEKVLKLKKGELDDYEAESRGAENQKRPLIQQGKSIILSTSHETVGESVVDVEISDPVTFKSQTDNTTYNLSLKYGKKVTFCNAGITGLVPDQAFNKYKKEGIFEPQDVGQVKGLTLFNLFCLDPNKFADTFVNLGKKKDYETTVDITKEINNNKKEFFDFLESVVGYNYILVHKIGSQVHYVDLRTERDMKNLVGNNIKHAEIWYGGKNGVGKVVYINVQLQNMDIMFNFRNKQGGVYPKSLMADYTIHH